MKKNKSRLEKNGRKPVLWKRVEIHPEAKRWIFIIFMFALAGIAVLGLFDMAGRAGQAIDSVLSLFLGWTKFIFPDYCSH